MLRILFILALILIQIPSAKADNYVPGVYIQKLLLSLQANDTIFRNLFDYINSTKLNKTDYSASSANVSCGVNLSCTVNGNNTSIDYNRTDFPNATVSAKEAIWDAKISSESDPIAMANISANIASWEAGGSAFNLTYHLHLFNFSNPHSVTMAQIGTNFPNETLAGIDTVQNSSIVALQNNDSYFNGSAFPNATNFRNDSTWVLASSKLSTETDPVALANISLNIMQWNNQTDPAAIHNNNASILLNSNQSLLLNTNTSLLLNNNQSIITDYNSSYPEAKNFWNITVGLNSAIWNAYAAMITALQANDSWWSANITRLDGANTIQNNSINNTQSNDTQLFANITRLDSVKLNISNLNSTVDRNSSNMTFASLSTHPAMQCGISCHGNLSNFSNTHAQFVSNLTLDRNLSNFSNVPGFVTNSTMASDNTKVNKTTDTMTGQLNLSLTNYSTTGLNMLAGTGSAFGSNGVETPYFTTYALNNSPNMNSNITSEIQLNGVQGWHIMNAGNVSLGVGYILYATPGGLPGFVLYNSSVGQRINMRMVGDGYAIEVSKTGSTNASNGIFISQNGFLSITGKGNSLKLTSIGGNTFCTSVSDIGVLSTVSC